MASTVDRAKLIKAVLKRLGAWQAGQDLSPEDYETVDEDLDGHLAAMAKADIYVVEDPDQVPIEAYIELAAYLALEYCDDFGVGGEELQGIAARAGLAEKALRYLRTLKPTYQPAQSIYY
jgi:hypothetical protein